MVSVLILGTKDHQHTHTNTHMITTSGRPTSMCDALTSLLAIVALFSAKFFGAIWMDPAMGVVGAVLVAQWTGFTENNRCCFRQAKRCVKRSGKNHDHLCTAPGV